MTCDQSAAQKEGRGVSSLLGTTAGITTYISLQHFGGQKKLLACKHARLEELSLTAAACMYIRLNPHMGRTSTCKE